MFSGLSIQKTRCETIGLPLPKGISNQMSMGKIQKMPSSSIPISFVCKVLTDKDCHHRNIQRKDDPMPG
jgi:hypothetical protein